MKIFFLSFSLVAASLCALCGTARAIEIADLRVEHLTNPLGIDAETPRFSWKLRDPDATRAQRQTAYHILVASTPEKLANGTGDIWDSGLVASAESHLVPFGGAAAKLQSGAVFHWKVLARDNAGKASAWSAPARFSLGLLNSEDWKGEWIKHPTAPIEKHLWFRKKLTLADAPATAFAHVASLGYHELYINGKKADERVLAPIISRLDRRPLYVTYDIAPLLRSGDNTVALWYSPGWSLYRENTNLNQTLLVQLNGTARNGTAFTLHTDATWKTAASNSQHIGRVPTNMGKMGGEQVDGRAENTAWNAPAFDDSAWENAVATTPRKDKKNVTLSAQMSDPTHIIASFHAKEIKADNGGWRVDMGRSYTGFLEAAFNGLKSGDTVTIKISDRAEARQSFEQEERYIARGENGEKFTNRFNFFGGRYIYIYGLKTQPKPEEITGHAITSAGKRTGTFTTSSELFNRIYDTDLWTYEMCNVEGVTTDCPNRERLGYGCESAYMTSWALGLPSFDSAAFYAKNVRDWSDVQRANGIIPNTAPQTHATAWGGPLWGAANTNLAWEHYLAHGDKTVLREAAASGKKWLDHLDKKSRDKTNTGAGTLLKYGAGGVENSGGFFLGDWLGPQHRKEQGGEAAHFFNNCVYAMALNQYVLIADALGLADDAAKYRKRYESTCAKIHEKWFNPKTNGYFNGDQVRNSFALHAGIVPADKREAVTAALEKDLTGAHPYFDIGSPARYPYFKVLFAGTRFQEIIAATLSKTTHPSYGYFFAKGETAWPECWEVKNDDCARIHTSYTGISGWFIKNLAGIEPTADAPAYRVFTLRPQVVKNLDHAAATLESPYGTIQSGWRKDGAKVHYDATVPVGAVAQLTLPAKAVQITESGKPLAQATGVKVLEETDGTVRLSLASGTYRFEVK